MRTLAIETATEACSIALFEGDDLVAHDHRVLGRGHAERLVPMIANLPDKGRAPRILVSLGPGSFTGVRIGIATARALGFAWGAEVLGYPTLALVATGVPDAGTVTVCMSGGHGEWFIADYSHGSRGLGEIASLTPECAEQRGANRCIVGSKAREFAALLGQEYTAQEALPDARLAYRLPSGILTTDLSPIYGRGPDAVPQSAKGQS